MEQDRPELSPGGEPLWSGHYREGEAPPGALAPKPPRSERPAPPAKEDLAEWWRRAVATLVDGLIVGGLTLLVLVALGVGIFAEGESGFGAVVVALLAGSVVFAALALLYAPIVMARTNGATLGKLLAGCRVVRAGGQRVTFGWAVLREVVVKGLVMGIASAITGGIAYLVDVLWPLVDKENRALHDLMVDSRVVLKRSRR